MASASRLRKVTKETRLHALEGQVHRVQRELKCLQRTSTHYSWVRLAIAVAGLLAAGLGFYLVDWWLAGICAGVAGLLFGLAVYAHRQVEGSIHRHQIWCAIKEAQIARARLDWTRIPSTFSQRPQAKHPFEADLDLVGRRSVHRLLDTAVSYEGSQRLRIWLTAPVPKLEEIVRRQRLVRELVPRSLFRDKLILNATAATGARKTWEADNLVRWLGRHVPEPGLSRWLLLLTALAGLNILLFAANWLGLVRPWWQITFALYLGLMLVRSRNTGVVWDEALALQDALQQLYGVFRQLETFPYYGTPQLRALCEPFLDSAHRPSRYLARITRVVVAMGIRGNPLIWFAVNAVVPWDLYFSNRLNQTKAAMSGRAAAWMDVWFELEALSSLAGLAYLNPSYEFPELLGSEGGEGKLMFRAEKLGHPLIPDGERVCNDLSVAELGQVTIITGSNMAGKSVFLKMVGVNLALAYAGGPVNARCLQTVLFRMFTSMGITDSVTDGISYFYAEVRRLKALLAALEQDHSLPLLFCIDEIFRGTNNRERLIGSRAYVRALAGKRGLGFIATHDLMLAELAEEMAQVENYHFRDRVAGDRMVFDYLLQPGPCPTTNALTIMQLEGLPVPTVPGEEPSGLPI